MKKNILVVDDDKNNLLLAQLILAGKEYEVFTARTGVEAISLLKQQAIDLVLLDVMMPMMDGMKTLQTIRSNAELASIPVIFLTAAADTDTVVEACRLEAMDYVKKPFIPADLRGRIEKAIG